MPDKGEQLRKTLEDAGISKEQFLESLGRACKGAAEGVTVLVHALKKIEQGTHPYIVIAEIEDPIVRMSAAKALVETQKYAMSKRMTTKRKRHSV